MVQSWVLPAPTVDTVHGEFGITVGVTCARAAGTARMENAKAAERAVTFIPKSSQRKERPATRFRIEQSGNTEASATPQKALVAFRLGLQPLCLHRGLPPLDCLLLCP